MKRSARLFPPPQAPRLQPLRAARPRPGDYRWWAELADGRGRGLGRGAGDVLTSGRADALGVARRGAGPALAAVGR